MTALALSLLMLSPLLPQVLRTFVGVPYVNDLAFYLFLVALGVARRPGAFKLVVWRPVLTGALTTILLLGALRNWQAGYSPNALRALGTHFVKPMLYVFLITFAYNYFRRFDRRWFERILTLGILASALSFGYDRATHDMVKEFSGYVGTGNTIGNLYVVTLPMVLVCSVLSAKWKWLLRGLAAIMVAVVLASASRGSALALAVVVSAYVFFRTAAPKAVKVTLGLGVVGLAAALLPDLLFGPTGVIAGYTDQELSELSTGRWAIWQLVAAYLENPGRFWWGGGPNDFLHVLAANRFSGGGLNTQNHVLLMWVDYGVVGLAVLAAVYTAVLRTARSAIRDGDREARVVGWGIVHAAIALSVIGMFSHFNVGSWHTAPLWVQVGWLAAAHQRAVATTPTKFRTRLTQRKATRPPRIPFRPTPVGVPLTERGRS